MSCFCSSPSCQKTVGNIRKLLLFLHNSMDACVGLCACVWKVAGNHIMTQRGGGDVSFSRLLLSDKTEASTVGSS